MSTLQLTHIYNITAKITLETGAHIGTGSDIMHIGGIDNAVIKHPYTQQPFIPGSSIKGKLRSLLEWRAGLPGLTKGQPVSLKLLESEVLNEHQKQQAEQIIKVFGASGDAKSEKLQEIGPTRAAFWDASLTEEWADFIQQNDYAYTEDKTENTIDRISAVAKNPRHTERVPAQTQFTFKMTLKKLCEEDEALLNMLIQGLKLLEEEGLGGSVSRGYGKIKFEDLQIDGQAVEGFDALDPFA